MKSWLRATWQGVFRWCAKAFAIKRSDVTDAEAVSEAHVGLPKAREGPTALAMENEDDRVSNAVLEEGILTPEELKRVKEAQQRIRRGTGDLPEGL